MNSSNVLANNESLKLGIAEDGWAPFELVENGQPSGYLVDYLELLADEANITLKWEIVPDRTTMVEAARSGRHQLLTYGAKVDKYKQDFRFGPQLIPRYIGAFTRSENDINWAQEKPLSQLIIASPKNWHITKFITQQYPDARLLITNSAKESLTAIAIGNADVTFVDLAVGHYIKQKELLPNLRNQAAPPEILAQFKPVHLLYGKALDEKTIQQIEAAAQRLPSTKLQEIYNKWFLKELGQNNSLNLTEAEKQWLAVAPTINVSAYKNLPPYSYQKNGHFIGFSIDYMRLLAKKLGINISFNSQGNWNEQQIMAENRSIDILQFLRYREEIDRYMDFSNAYFEGAPSLLFGRSDSASLNALADITSHRVIVIKSHLEEIYIREHFPKINLDAVENVGAGVNKILRGDADYFICDPTTCENYLTKNFISNVVVKGPLGIPALDESKNARLAIREDWPLLVSSVNKAIAAVTRSELNQLRQKWVMENSQPESPIKSLTETEKHWLLNNSRLAFSSPLKSAPFGFFDANGEYSGVAKDIVKVFEEQYDVDTHLERFDTWGDTYQALLVGEIDFIAPMSITPERMKNLLFTTPIHNLTYAIHTQFGDRFYNDVSELVNKRIGAVRGGGTAEYLKTNYPDLNIIEYPNVQDVVKALSKGDIDALLEIPAILRYHTQTLDIKNIKKSGDTDFSIQAGIAVHPSKPELVTLFNKVLASMGEKQIEILTDKWSNVRVIEKDDWKIMLYWSISIALALLIIVLLFAYLNRRSGLNLLSQTSQQLENAQRVAQLGSWQINSENNMLNLSTEACSILHVAKGKVISRMDYIQMIDIQDRETYLSAWNKALLSGLINIEYRLHINNSSKWVNEIVELQFDNAGKLKSGSAILQDISTFKEQQQALMDGQTELRELTSKLLNVQEEERRRVARELHDDLSQRLAVISIDAGTLEMNIEDDTIKQPLRKIKQGLISIAEDTHSLSRRLHPSILDDLGLIAALQSEIENFQRRHDIKVDFFCSVKSLPLSKQADLAVFRIIQEALRNIAKYSEAANVKINLTIIKEALILQIIDDGMGFDVGEAKKSPGLGLQSMMERAKLVGGELTINSVENRGTTIELHLNVDEQCSTL